MAQDNSPPFFPLALPLALLLASIAGCAALIKGTTQQVTFNSDPPGAKVYLEEEMVGTTPVTLSLRKNKFVTAVLEKEGYETVYQDLTTSFDPIMLLNFFGDLGITDFILGTAYEYDPDQYMAILVPTNPDAPANTVTPNPTPTPSSQ